MNAQEAIAIMEKELNDLKENYEYFKESSDGSIYVSADRTMNAKYKNDIQALSIVLESAKLLHGAKKVKYWKHGKVSTIEFIMKTHQEDWEKTGIEQEVEPISKNKGMPDTLFMKLLSKAQKEAEQLNKTIAQLNNLKLGVDSIFIKNPRVELRIDGKKVN